MRISSPPDSQGVGSGSSVMCTQRTGASRRVLAAEQLEPELVDEVANGQHAVTGVAHLAPERSAASVTPRPVGRLGEHLAQHAADLLELLGVGDQRRRQLDHRVAAVVGAADQPVLVERAGEEAAQQPLGLLVVEGLLGVLVLDQLDRVEVAGAAHVADDRDVAQPLEHRAELALLARSTWPQRSSRSKMSRFASAAAAETGWPPKVKPWVNMLVPSRNGLGDAVGRDHRAHRRVGRGQRLRRRDDVRHVVVALAAEVVAEPAPGADHLVGDQQHAVAVADLAHALPVALLRREAAAGVLDRLEDHRRDGLGALEEDPLLDRVGRPERVALLRPAVAVGVRHVAAAGGQRLERRAQVGDAGRGERAHRGAVVGDLARDRACSGRPRRCGGGRCAQSFSADSTASLPPEVKKTRLRSPGA